MSDPTNYTIGWICAIMPELVAAQVFLEEIHEKLIYNDHNDSNTYTLGKMGKHNVAIATLPNGQYGLVSAATVAKDMQRTFPNLRICLMVGIGGGAPTNKNDIRLGDVVVSEPGNGSGGVFQYDYGKAIQEQGFLETGFLNTPPKLLGNAVADLRAAHEINGHQINDDISRILDSKPRLKKKYQRPDPSTDKLYRSDVVHPPGKDGDCVTVCGDGEDRIVIRPERTEDDDDPAIHYGVIASANQLMKNALLRDQFAKDRNILCFEMEAAGLMNDFPCLVIRGICDYADTHKNQQWQGYAAMVAAAYAKDLLSRITPTQIEAEKKIRELVADIRDVVSTTAADIKVVKADVRKREDIEVLDWLTTIDYGLKQSDTFNSREPGTGKWFLDSQEYQNWINSKNENTLFCPGMPGAGKTTIVSVIVDNLKMRFNGDPSVGIAYIYCVYRGEGEQRLDLLLASLVKQLASLLPSLPSTLQALYQKHKCDQTRSSIEELTSVLHSAASQFSTIFIILDALDELRETNTSWAKLLTELFKLQKMLHIKIVATSRPISEIANKFNGCLSLEIRAQASDVLCYLEGQLSHLPAFVEERPELQEEIRTKITSAVDGMFLLAKLYFDSLRGKKSARILRKTLDSIGTTADSYGQAYDQAMERINSQLQDETKLAKEVLSWIIFAKRSLKISELLHALAVEPGDSEPDKENVPHLSHVISVCAGLVTVDTKSNIIRLVHYTTQQYFERTHSHWLPNAEDDIADICVTYLSYNVFETLSITKDHELNEHEHLYPFYDYAALNWGYHARQSARLSKIAISFLNSQTKVELSSQILINRLYKNYRHIIKPLMSLHLVAFFGVDKIAAQMLPSPDLDAKDFEGRTPLSWAAENGHEATVALLLKNGADINLKDYRKQTPLSYAAQNGHEATITLLLKNGAGIDLKDYYEQTPLSYAAQNGHEATVALLLKNGAGIDLEDFYGRTQLSHAAENGHEATIALLLENGASVDLKDRDNRTPLSWAAENGHEATVALLLENGADINLTDDDYGQTPLGWAAENGHEATVALLLENGANANLVDYNNQTPLNWAAGNGQEATVALLLENGADINLKDYYDRTSLSWAVQGGHEATVALLLKSGADIDLKDKDNRTPLSWAAQNTHEAIITLLLKHGADASYASLTEAVSNHNEVVFKLLLEAGANVSLRGGSSGRTPLMEAIELRDEALTRLLLENGANPNSNEGNYGVIPLGLAALKGDKAIVKLLLEKGADPKLKDSFGYTPLFWGRGNDDGGINRLLLEENPILSQRIKRVKL